MTNKASIHVIVHGHVQGVYFRAFVYQKASALDLTGYVQNLSSGRDVDIQAEGDKDKLEKLLDSIKTGPKGSKIESVTVKWSSYTGEHTDFAIYY